MILQYHPYFYERCTINYRQEIKSKYIHNWGQAISPYSTMKSLIKDTHALSWFHPVNLDFSQFLPYTELSCTLSSNCSQDAEA